MTKERQGSSSHHEGVFPEETIQFGNGFELIPDSVEENIVKNPDKIKEIFSGRKVIIVGPHPDDPELSMGVMEHLLSRFATSVQVISVTTGYNGVTDEYARIKLQLNEDQVLDTNLKAGIRIDEEKQAASILGVKSYDNLDITIPKLVEVNTDHEKSGVRLRFESRYGEIDPEGIAKISSLVSDSPNVVWFLPYPFRTQPHHDVHERVGLGFIEILAKSGIENVWFYETYERQVDFDVEGVKPNFIVAFADELMSYKTRAIQTFESQISRDPDGYGMMPIRRNEYYAWQLSLLERGAERFLRGQLRMSSNLPPYRNPPSDI